MFQNFVMRIDFTEQFRQFSFFLGPISIQRKDYKGSLQGKVMKKIPIKETLLNKKSIDRLFRLAEKLTNLQIDELTPKKANLINIIKKKNSFSMTFQTPKHYGFYHEESKTFFYFENEQQFNQFLQLYNRYETQAKQEMEELARPNLDAFNSVFEDINSSSFDSGQELHEFDF